MIAVASLSEGTHRAGGRRPALQTQRGTILGSPGLSHSTVAVMPTSSSCLASPRLVDHLHQCQGRDEREREAKQPWKSSVLPEALHQPSKRERRSRPHAGEDLVLPGTSMASHESAYSNHWSAKESAASVLQPPAGKFSACQSFDGHCVRRGRGAGRGGASKGRGRAFCGTRGVRAALTLMVAPWAFRMAATRRSPGASIVRA